MLGALKARGHTVADMHKAAIGIVNTCAFVHDAKTESIDAILDLIQLKKEGKLKKIIVCGCLAQRYGDTLRRELPEVDAFVGAQSLEASVERFALTPAHYAYLKISEGCVSKCSFCVIPRIKGPYTSLSERAVLAQSRMFDSQSVAELNIIGQDVTAYGVDLPGKPGLARLLARVIKTAPHIRWFRLLYLYPSRITDELLAVIRDEPRFCKYIDVPIQHSASRILKLMNRGSTRDSLRRLIDRIRTALPGAALRTSVIVGFPSETDREFEGLLAFIKEARFERLGAFIYSAEESTPAAGLPGQIPQTVQRERFNRLMALQQQISGECNERLLGTEMEVLIEERDQAGGYLARSQFDAPEVDGLVYVRTRKKFIPGDFAKVRICDTLEYDLVGETL